MSRTAEGHQTSPIWQLTTLAQGKLRTYRTQKVGRDAWQINSKENYMGLLAIWLQILIDTQKDDKKIIERNNFDTQSNETMALYVPGKAKRLVFSIWQLVAKFGLGDDAYFCGNYAFCSRVASHSNLLTLYRPTIHPNQLVEAVLHGDEKMMRDLLNGAPELLLQSGTATDLSARTFTGSALQAAIAVGDVAPNSASTGMVEIMLTHLQQHHPEDYKRLFTEQALALYKESLDVYVKIQTKEIARLRALAGELAENTAEQTDANLKLAQAEKRLAAYQIALESNDLTVIFDTHVKAQKDNVFDGFNAAIAAIEKATDAEIQAVFNDPKIDSPLGNVIRQCRIDFTQHSHSEKIVNCEHLLELFKLYDEFYFRVMNADPSRKKRELFWCHLVGGVQRDFAACDAQVFANPGLYPSVENNERLSRSFDFKYGGGSIFPLALDSNSGLGYEFAAGATLHGKFEGCNVGECLQNVCRAKTANLEKFIRQFAPKPASECLCVMQ